MAQLVCRDLSVGYGGKTVLSGLNFSLNSGEYVCVLGENGSGKSTLMKTLLGLLPPVSGSISAGEGLKSTEIGYLPQQTDFQRDFPASVREIVLSGCQSRCRGGFFYGKSEKSLANEAMEKMRISELSARSYKELSGGQQQRVLLARALCAAKKMLLLDEPVTGLDPAAAAEMYELIYGLNRNDGITVLMISHDISAALRYADSVLHIGENVFFGPAGEYAECPLCGGKHGTKGDRP